MNRNWMVGGALAMVALTLVEVGSARAQESASQEGRREVPAAQQGAGGEESGQTGALVRVAPVQQDGSASRLRLGQDLDGDGVADHVPFSPDHWLYQLGDPDLNQRMRNFEQIVELARRSREAHDWLVERSRDTADPELAWTAKLALREIEQRGPGLFFSAPGMHSLGPDATQEELRDSILRLFGGHDFQLGPGGADPLSLDTFHALDKDADGNLHSKSVKVDAGPDGVRVTVTETVDGKEQSTDYEAESIEALLEANPQLEELLGKGGRGLGFSLPGEPFSFDLDGLRLELDRAFGGLAPFDGLLQGGEGVHDLDWLEASPRRDVFGVYVAVPSDGQLRARGLDADGGILVEDVAPGTVAEELGIAAGDVLLRMNGVALSASDQIGDAMRSARQRGVDLVVEGVDATGKPWTRTWSAPKPIESGESGQ